MPVPRSRSAEGSAWVLAGRIAVLGVAGLAVVSAFAIAGARDRERARASTSDARYVCPMHPEVISRVPGECPICRMALEPVGPAGAAATAPRSATSGTVAVVKRRVVTRIVRAPAWVGADGVGTAILHEDDLQGLAPDEPARFYGAATAGAAAPVSLVPGRPEPWDAATVQIRFHGARRADTGWLQLAARPRDLLVVPASAVLYSGDGAYVLAAPPDGHTFTRRSIEIGRILDSGYVAGLADDRSGAIVVRAGLEEGERIIVEDTFFLDAERRLQASHGNPAEVTL